MMSVNAMGEIPPIPTTFAVRVTRDRLQLETWLLTLRSRGIPALLQRGDGEVVLHVLPTHADDARRELDAIDAEELEVRRAADAEAAAAVDSARFESALAPVGGALVAMLLVAMFMVTGPVIGRSVWFGAGASDAVRVLDGEWWRAITALTLHADSNHVLSNVALGAIVVTAVMRRTGVGYGAALVVLAGTLGNVVNAWAYSSHHSSIGFSTAVFGAIGILAGLTYVTALRGNTGFVRRRRPAWTAIAGALALLALLGASERSDMLAHLFGTFAGIAVGLGVGFSRWVPRRWLGQTLVGVGTLGVLVGAWAMALATQAA